MAETERGTPQEQVRRLYEDAEARTAKAMEEVVGRPSFGELLARMTENVMAVTRIGNDTFDLFVRNLRLAGRHDITRLSRQLARTEDKLEMVLQEVERLQAQLDGQAQDTATTTSGSGAGERRSRSRSGNGRRRSTESRGGGNSGSPGGTRGRSTRGGSKSGS